MLQCEIFLTIPIRICFTCPELFEDCKMPSRESHVFIRIPACFLWRKPLGFHPSQTWANNQMSSSSSTTCPAVAIGSITLNRFPQLRDNYKAQKDTASAKVLCTFPLSIFHEKTIKANAKYCIIKQVVASRKTGHAAVWSLWSWLIKTPLKVIDRFPNPGSHHLIHCLWFKLSFQSMLYFMSTPECPCFNLPSLWILTQFELILYDPSHKDMLSLIPTRKELYLSSFGERNN